MSLLFTVLLMKILDTCKTLSTEVRADLAPIGCHLSRVQPGVPCSIQPNGSRHSTTSITEAGVVVTVQDIRLFHDLLAEEVEFPVLAWDVVYCE